MEQQPRFKRALHSEAHEPTIAPGLEDDELQRPATDEERARGDTTMVCQLSFDEHDNGSQD
ncbi:hypothetical protein [Tumebacillus lipolyticus]|uniref:Uncharacterized protein n=1 Tax=Tumebacillus lipolyticus TaxID=1280370 RepID=A0ABW4ZUX5_9BACL